VNQIIHENIQTRVGFSPANKSPGRKSFMEGDRGRKPRKRRTGGVREAGVEGVGSGRNREKVRSIEPKYI